MVPDSLPHYTTNICTGTKRLLNFHDSSPHSTNEIATILQTNVILGFQIYPRKSDNAVN